MDDSIKDVEGVVILSDTFAPPTLEEWVERAATMTDVGIVVDVTRDVVQDAKDGKIAVRDIDDEIDRRMLGAFRGKQRSDTKPDRSL